MKKNFFVFVALLMLVAGSSTQASAALVTDGKDFSFTGFSSPLNLTLNKFDTSLGTLTGITLHFNTIITPQAGILNITNTSQPFWANSKGTVTFTAPGLDPLALKFDTGLLTGTAPQPPPMITYYSGTPSSYSDSTAIASALWIFYQANGGGNVAFSGAFSPFDVIGSGNIYVSGNALAQGHIGIDYNYTPVPIPAAIWLLGTGLLGLAGFRRKMKK